MAIQSDFMSAIRQICAERGIEVDDVVEAIKTAMLSAYRKGYDTGESLTVEIDPEFGTLQVFADKKVVTKVTDTHTQISLKHAQQIEPKLRVGDHIEIEVTPEGDFGRIAAQTAKQVILQQIREAEKEAVIKEFKDKLGTIETAIVQRMDGQNVVLEIRKATAIMLPEEQISNEFYRSGQRLKVLVKQIQKTPKGKRLLASRSDDNFLVELFKLEVPELASGSIDIKSIAREAGSRTKLAVWANVDGVDPIGSFVGQKGLRITNVMNELRNERGEEKIDIILWDENFENFIQNALSPAKVISVKVNNETKEALVIVPDDQLSLAIGREGQNVRLAAKLTGWKIDIRGESDKPEAETEAKAKTSTKKNEEKATVKKESKLVSVLEEKGVAKRTINAILKTGIKTEKELKTIIDKGDKIEGIGAKSIEEIKNSLAK